MDSILAKKIMLDLSAKAVEDGIDPSVINVAIQLIRKTPDTDKVFKRKVLYFNGKNASQIVKQLTFVPKFGPARQHYTASVGDKGELIIGGHDSITAPAYILPFEYSKETQGNVKIALITEDPADLSKFLSSVDDGGAFEATSVTFHA